MPTGMDTPFGGWSRFRLSNGTVVSMYIIPVNVVSPRFQVDLQRLMTVRKNYDFRQRRAFDRLRVPYVETLWSDGMEPVHTVQTYRYLYCGRVSMSLNSSYSITVLYEYSTGKAR